MKPSTQSIHPVDFRFTAIDLFAGLGGFTEAARRAGVRVLWAANHWQAAVDVHALNHRDVIHSCQDLQQADWEAVPAHDILLASPCCQGHSKARGKDRPHSDKSRSTAWAVVSCAEFHRPQFVVVENVPDFAKWALYPAWRAAMNALGYALSVNTFDAADSGVPQNRLRMFIVGSRSKHSMWINPPALPQTTASAFIDWSAGKWSEIDRAGRAEKTLLRCEHGRKAFGDRFLHCYYGNTKTARSIHRPIGTITTHDRWALADGDRMRMLLVSEALAAMGFASDYALPSNGRLAMHMIGNAVCPDAAAHVLREIARAA